MTYKWYTLNTIIAPPSTSALTNPSITIVVDGVIVTLFIHHAIPPDDHKDHNIYVHFSSEMALQLCAGSHFLLKPKQITIVSVLN